MKKEILLLAIILKTVFIQAQSPNWVWANSIGGPTEDSGRALVLDAAGNVYSTGNYKGTADFDPGPGVFNLTSNGNNDVFITKTDAAGNFVWAKSIGSTSYDAGTGISVNAAGDVCVVGHYIATVDFDPGSGVVNYNSSTDGCNMFILKLNTAGDFLWAKVMGGTSATYVNAVTEDAAGNIYTTGSFGTYGDFDPGSGVYPLSVSGAAMFISKLDALGNFVWAKQIGGTTYDYGRAIKIDPTGDLVIAGSFGGTADFDPGVGVSNLTSAGGFDTFVCKMDTAGVFIWAKGVGGPNTESGISMDVDGLGNIYTTGSFSGTVDFDPGAGVALCSTVVLGDIYLFKLNSSGNFVWVKTMGGPGDDGGFAVTVDALNNVYTTGFFNDSADFDPGIDSLRLTSAGGWDIFITKFSSAGNFIWAKSAGSANHESGYGLAVDPSGYVYFTAEYASPTLVLAPITLTNVVSVGYYSDMVIAKLNYGTIGIDEQNNGSLISLFPNPTSNYLTIETTKPTNISIVNLLGQEICHSKIKTSERIDVSFLSNGIYFVKDLQNGGSIKFVKQ